jgi:NADPH:quinone reductase-like Zn-dependent oxidoreductase
VALPHVPGIDVAGTIVSLGDGVTGWAAGDQVIGFLPMASDGASDEFVVAPAAWR